MDTFSKNQQQMRDYLKNPIQGFSFMENFEDIAKQNMKLFEDTFKAFTDFTTPKKKD
jgi:polyhydroxyalkanoate synthesis regulator protein